MFRIALSFLCLSDLVAAQNPPGNTLEPAWTWSASSAIEWCHTLGNPPITLLIQTQDGRLDQLNLISGKSAFRKTPADVKGQRFAGICADAVFLYDDEMIRTIAISRAAPTAKPDAAELWSIDAASTIEKPRDDDPEFKRRLLAARPTTAGLLIARSDGRIAELNRADGSIKWSAALPPSAEVRLFVLDNVAIVLHRGKPGIDASLFNLSAAAPTPQTIDFADSWPMWCELCPDGLIAAWPGKITRLSADGKIETPRPRFKPPIRAEALAVLPRLQSSSRPLLALLDQSGDLSAHDMLTSERVWDAKVESPRAATLETAGERVLVIGDRGEIEAHHRDAGALVARYTGSPAARSLGAAIVGNYLFGLRSTRTAGGDGLQLVRTPLLRPGDWTAQRAAATEAAWPLERAGKTRAILWPAGRLVIIEDRRIRTFVLPAE